MNTPSHVIINLALLRRFTPSPINWFSIIGSLIPDFAIFVFYAWAKLIARLPESEIWSETYFREDWQTVFAVGNSIPIALLGLAIAIFLKQTWLGLISGSMLLHHLEDLPFHGEDAHQHFFPFSDYRFISPISYWDPNRSGAIVALVELALVVVASTTLIPHMTSVWGRYILFGILGLQTVAYIGFYLA